jgi:hypothetical protein
MGELITDEEIDMMISMCDLDGDGQISIDEFRVLVQHPNPGNIDIQKIIADKKMEELEVFEEFQEWFYTKLETSANQKKAEIKNWLNCALKQESASKSIEISNNGDCESWEFLIAN